MKEFIKKIISAIVAEPEKAEIQEKEEEGLTIYTIFVPSEEVGKIIGKGGKVINSLRTLCRLKASKTQKRILVRVEAKQV